MSARTAPRAGARRGRVGARTSAPSTKELHRAWLTLVETDGPFLSVPALTKAWPQGMPPPSVDAVAALRDAVPGFDAAWEKRDTHRDDEAVLARYREERDTWIEAVLRDVLGWSQDYSASPGTTPVISSPDRTVTVTATGTLTSDDHVGALVLVVDPVDSLHVSTGDGWAASPIDRTEELLRRAGVPVGVVTDGRWWAVVSARKDTAVASGVVDALAWVSERPAFDAFVELLSRRSLVGRTGAALLTDVFADSVAAAEDITIALGTQVRRAVELLVAAFSETAAEARRDGSPDPLPPRRGEVYDAAVTVMMRTVFLLFAEERNLLPQSRLFSGGYGISGELDRLSTRYTQEGAEALDGTSSTWHRLLATSRALHDGATFEDLRLPAYGGSLFDASRFSFLAARTPRGTLAVSVSDRVMLEVLRALQVAVVKGEARRISFREIDVEQIGYIYEGLLGHTCEQVEEVTVGLIGTLGAEPEMTLATLEALNNRFADTGRLAEEIRTVVGQEQPGATPGTRARLKKGLDTAGGEDADRALRAVTDDAELRERLRPFVGVIRRDLRERPVVIAPGGLVVVETPSRATAGAHYTPRSLAEEVVEHALKPLLYSVGPHQTPDEGAWVPISSDEILDLNVADIACGSGAFLVAAARYLAKALVEAWYREGVGGGDPHDLEVGAVRKVVARCLYGADINAMAVEMCKLSLWLVSLDPHLPFSFVDDKVLHGNSLLGLTDVRQIEALNIDPTAQQPQTLFSTDLDAVMSRAVRLRQALASEVVPEDPQRSTATKVRQLREYQRLIAPASELADAVVAAGLRVGGKPGRQLKAAYENLAIAVSNAYGPERNRTMLDGILAAGLNPTVPTDYERWKPLHWALVVPDVMATGGFDAVIGNPPFLGGQRLTGALGTEVRDWFVNVLAGGQRGSADLVAYFFLRAASLLKPQGALGLIATNTVAQGTTREVGLDRLAADGMTITRAIQSRSWPSTSANLE